MAIQVYIEFVTKQQIIKYLEANEHCKRQFERFSFNQYVNPRFAVLLKHISEMIFLSIATFFSEMFSIDVFTIQWLILDETVRESSLNYYLFRFLRFCFKSNTVCNTLKIFTINFHFIGDTDSLDNTKLIFVFSK